MAGRPPVDHVILDSAESIGNGKLKSQCMGMEVDLSNLGTVNTMFAALFSKLGVPIKTTISANVLEEALNGTVTVRPLPIRTSVEKQCAHFFGVRINGEQAAAGIVVRVTSAAQSKFKVVPLQTGSKDCGMFVMRYMKEIVEDKELQFVAKWMRMSNLVYTDDDINEIRIDIAKYFMKRHAC